MAADARVPCNRSVRFFDEHFRRLSTDAALRLNPFEELALPYLRGKVLDFGCGLGNLAFAAAGRGCRVSALDASPAAIERIRVRAAAEHAPVFATLADLRDHQLTENYDCVVSIGLLMFFDCPTAYRVLALMKDHVRPGGTAIVNVLIEGTTYMEMFDPAGHCLFAASELQRRFDDWAIERMEFDDFLATDDTLKRFCTVVARKPSSSAKPEA